MTRPQCRALDLNGHVCQRHDTIWVSYHGDSELYDYDGPRPGWVLVPLCKGHRKDNEKPFVAPKRRSSHA